MKRDQYREVRGNVLDKSAEGKKKSKIYTTERINQILSDIKNGKEPDMDPFYHGKLEYKDSGITFQLTDEERKELDKCSEDCLYFVKNYAKFRNDKGLTLVQLRPYQEDVLHLMGDEIWDEELQDVRMKNKRIILMQSRQTGKTTTTAAYFTWYLVFHFERNVMITANKESTSKEILGKVKDVLTNIPFFMKPGIVSVSDKRIKLENGCSLRCVATSNTSTTGDSLNILLIDECALIPINIVNAFWQSVFPTLSSFKQSQIIVLSTPRGRTGLYYDLWTNANKIDPSTGISKNGFIAKRVDWYEVPGRDEQWKLDQISAFGEANFNQEFALSFDVNESKLINQRDFIFMEKIQKKFVSVEIYGIPKRITSKIFWHPDFNPDQLTYEDKLNRKFVMIIDTAEGKTKEFEEETKEGRMIKKDPDYNVIDIFEVKLLSPIKIIQNRLGYKAVKTKECIYLQQIGIYMDNNFDEEECAQVAQNIAFNVFNCGGGYEGEIDNVRIKYEDNFNGHNFKNIFCNHDMYYDGILTAFHTSGGNHGKNYYCEYGAKLISLRQIVVMQTHEIGTLSTIHQLKSFGKLKEKYQGIGSHDDIAVTVLFASRFFEDDIFISWIEEWIDDLPMKNYGDYKFKQKLKQIFELRQKYAEQLDDEMSDQDFKDYVLNAAEGFGKIHNLDNVPTYGNIIRQSAQNNIQQMSTYHHPLRTNIITNTKYIK